MSFLKGNLSYSLKPTISFGKTSTDHEIPSEKIAAPKGPTIETSIDLGFDADAVERHGDDIAPPALDEDPLASFREMRGEAGVKEGDDTSGLERPEIGRDDPRDLDPFGSRSGSRGDRDEGEGPAIGDGGMASNDDDADRKLTEEEFQAAMEQILEAWRDLQREMPDILGQPDPVAPDGGTGGTGGRPNPEGDDGGGKPPEVDGPVDLGIRPDIRPGIEGDDGGRPKAPELTPGDVVMPDTTPHPDDAPDHKTPPHEDVLADFEKPDVNPSEGRFDQSGSAFDFSGLASLGPIGGDDGGIFLAEADDRDATKAPATIDAAYQADTIFVPPAFPDDGFV